MRLDSVLELRSSLADSVLKPLTALVASRAAQGSPERSPGAPGGGQATMALGIVRKAGQDFALAVRIQRRDLENSRELEAITKAARGEVDVRYIGRVVKASTPWQRERTRPLEMGVSVGHHGIDSGSIGCFVRGLDPRDERAVMILSNNHVLADENRARLGDPILQSSAEDGGQDPDDRVATLTRMVKLKKVGANLVDAAVARLAPGIEYDPTTLTGLGGPLAGVGDPMPEEGTPVGKVGRTTGATHGRAIAFGLNNLHVGYATGVLSFDNQLEFAGNGEAPFGLKGDSGSLIVDADRRALGLLFAVSDGSTSGKAVRVFANPLDAILRQLKVELISRSSEAPNQPRPNPTTEQSPPRGEITLDEARAAQPKALIAIGQIAAVVGVGITRKGDSYALKVNLARPPHPNARLPETIDGVPVRVEVVGTIRKA